LIANVFPISKMHLWTIKVVKINTRYLPLYNINVNLIVIILNTFDLIINRAVKFKNKVEFESFRAFIDLFAL